MKTRLSFTHFLFLLGMASTTLLSSCGDQETLGNGDHVPSCNQPAGSLSAMIGVTDGGLRILCGCDETSGSFFGPNDPLTCTARVNTVVNFVYTGSRNWHQIDGVGSPRLPTSHRYDPNGDNELPSVHAVKLDEAGTYEFRDNATLSLTGSIVIN